MWNWSLRLSFCIPRKLMTDWWKTFSPGIWEEKLRCSVAVLFELFCGIYGRKEMLDPMKISLLTLVSWLLWSCPKYNIDIFTQEILSYLQPLDDYQLLEGSHFIASDWGVSFTLALRLFFFFWEYLLMISLRKKLVGTVNESRW